MKKKLGALRSKRSILFLLLVFTSIIFLFQSCEINSPGEINIPASTPSTNLQPLDPWINPTFGIDSSRSNDFIFTSSAIFTESTITESILWVYILSLDSNQVEYASPGVSIPVPDGILISESTGWGDTSGSLASTELTTPWRGPWAGTTPKNLAVRVYRNGAYYYGWIKLYVDSTNAYLNITDYAVSKTPGTPIIAGVHP
jgi:hypothetical protein